jgi:hypothetical protein
MVTTGLQNNKSRFNLVLCEILNKHLHGNDGNIDGHYLIINKFDASTGSAIYSGSDNDSESDDDDDYSWKHSNYKSFNNKNIFYIIIYIYIKQTNDRKITKK